MISDEVLVSHATCQVPAHDGIPPTVRGVGEGRGEGLWPILTYIIPETLSHTPGENTA